MGKGSIIAGQIAEMTIPTMLVFAIIFGIAKNGLKLKSGALQVIVLWLLTLVVVSGAINVLFYKSIHAAGASSVLFVVIPLVVCLLVVFFVAPRRKQDASSGEIS